MYYDCFLSPLLITELRQQSEIFLLYNHLM